MVTHMRYATLAILVYIAVALTIVLVRLEGLFFTC